MDNSNSICHLNYEWKVVTLLSLGFGIVGLDRWIISPPLPSMITEISQTLVLKRAVRRFCGSVIGCYCKPLLDGNCT